MITHPKINEKERKVLEMLAEEWSSDMNCYYFRGIVSKTGLELKEVRRACRSLAKKGLAQYVRGLFDDEGKTAGSGYCATRLGASLIDPCDICGDVITFKYEMDAAGLHGWDKGFDESTKRTVRACDQHDKEAKEKKPEQAQLV